MKAILDSMENPVLSATLLTALLMGLWVIIDKIFKPDPDYASPSIMYRDAKNPYFTREEVFNKLKLSTEYTRPTRFRTGAGIGGGSVGYFDLDKDEITFKGFKDGTLGSYAVIAHEIGHSYQKHARTLAHRLCALFRIFVYTKFLVYPFIFIGTAKALIGDPVGTSPEWCLMTSLFLLMLDILYETFNLYSEKDASRRAIALLIGNGICGKDEIGDLEEVLGWCYGTYYTRWVGKGLKVLTYIPFMIWILYAYC